MGREVRLCLPVRSACTQVATSARALHQRGSTTDEDVEHPELAKMAGLLVVAVVMVPDLLISMGGFTRLFHGGRRSASSKDAGAATGPPLGHLIDGLARIAFEFGDCIDRRDWKVHFQADG